MVFYERFNSVSHTNYKKMNDVELVKWKKTCCKVIPKFDETLTTCIIMHEIFVGSSGEILQAEYHFYNDTSTTIRNSTTLLQFKCALESFYSRYLHVWLNCPNLEQAQPFIQAKYLISRLSKKTIKTPCGNWREIL